MRLTWTGQGSHLTSVGVAYEIWEQRCSVLCYILSDLLSRTRLLSKHNYLMGWDFWCSEEIQEKGLFPHLG